MGFFKKRGTKGVRPKRTSRAQSQRLANALEGLEAKAHSGAVRASGKKEGAGSKPAPKPRLKLPKKPANIVLADKLAGLKLDGPQLLAALKDPGGMKALQTDIISSGFKSGGEVRIANKIRALLEKGKPIEVILDTLRNPKL